jgi:hypothetical protein
MNYALLSCALFSVLSISAVDVPSSPITSPEKPRSTVSFKQLLVRPRGDRVSARVIHPEISTPSPSAVSFKKGARYLITSYFSPRANVSKDSIQWIGKFVEEQGDDDCCLLLFKVYAVQKGRWRTKDKIFYIHIPKDEIGFGLGKKHSAVATTEKRKDIVWTVDGGVSVLDSSLVARALTFVGVAYQPNRFLASFVDRYSYEEVPVSFYVGDQYRLHLIQGEE